MITEIQDDILAALATISGIKELGEWEGDVEDLLKQPHLLPALFVIYSGADFSERRVINNVQVEHTMTWSVIVVARNLKSRSEGARACYPIIEDVRKELIGRVVGTYGFLWPTEEGLVFSEKGTLAYGLKYELKGKTARDS